MHENWRFKMKKKRRRFPSDEILFLSKEYFNSINNRNFAEADRIIDKIKNTSTKSDRLNGFLSALEGMRLSIYTNEKYAFIVQLPTVQKDVQKLKKDFNKKIRNPLSTNFDKGFFTAWLEYIEYYAKTLQ